MRTLVIIPCGKQKIWKWYPYIGKVAAVDAYKSTLFKYNLEYAKKFGDSFIILSARHGFIKPTFMISNYNMRIDDLLACSTDLLKKQIKEMNLNSFDTIIGLGGILYRKRIELAFYPRKVEFPFTNCRSMFEMVTLIKKAML